MFADYYYSIMKALETIVCVCVLSKKSPKNPNEQTMKKKKQKQKRFHPFRQIKQEKAENLFVLLFCGQISSYSETASHSRRLWTY